MIMIKFCLCFAFCTCCLCGAFVFCLRAWHLHKVEKIDPVNVVKPQKKLTVLAAAKRSERVKEILDLG